MKRSTLSRRFAGIAVLTALLATAIGPATAADETVDMPTLLSVSGSAAFIGKQALESVQRLAAAINAQGGIRGKMLKVSLQDTTSTPATAVQLLNGLISAHVQAVFGPTFTAECSALAPLITSGPIVSCFSPGVHPPAGSFMFSGGVGSDSMAHSIATYFRGKGYTRIAIISSTDASGQDFEENFDKAMAEPANSSMKLVGREHFATSDISVAAQIARIKSSNPQTLIVWTAGTGLGVALHAVHDVGLDVPIMAGNGNMVRAQLTGYEAFLPKTLMFPGILGMTPLASSPGPGSPWPRPPAKPRKRSTSPPTRKTVSSPICRVRSRGTRPISCSTHTKPSAGTPPRSNSATGSFRNTRGPASTASTTSQNSRNAALGRNHASSTAGIRKPTTSSRSAVPAV